MKKGISLLLVVTVLVVIMLMGSIAVVSPSTGYNTAQVYIYPEERPEVAKGTEVSVQVRINSSLGRGAPHETDKTWAWEIVISFDPEIIQVTAEPYRHATRDWFNTFHLWSWDGIDLGPYPTIFVKAVDNDKGEVAAACVLSEDPTVYPFPLVDFPNRWLHEGDHFNLPYTDGIPTANLEPPPVGWWGDYFILFIFKVTTEVDCNETAGTDIRIKEADFWCNDAMTKYPVDTKNGSIGTPPNPDNGAVGGFWIPVDKISLLAPYIALVSTIILTTAASVAYIKYRKKQ